jgi:drug/metabolite transporter (DMT)-like permease
VVGTVVGVFVLGESIDPLTLLGFGLVAVGFALLKREAIADLTGLTGDGVTP